MEMFGSKQKGTGAKSVSIATSQYRTPCVFLRHNTGAKFQLPKPMSSQSVRFVSILLPLMMSTFSNLPNTKT